MEADLGPQDVVLEVGPGQGVLTRELVRTAGKVVAIEVDPHLAVALPGRLKNPLNLTVVNEDARDVDLNTVLKGISSYKMVSNLPYYAANPILRRFLEGDHLKPSRMVVMVQKEVAQSMVAEKGRMSLLSVGIQLYANPRIICDVPPEAFRPSPKVTSAIVGLETLPQPAVEVDDVDGFFMVVKAGFAAPRKQLRNSLSLGLDTGTSRTSSLLEMAGLDPRRRAESLSLKEWADLYHACKGDWTGENKGLRKD